MCKTKLEDAKILLCGIYCDSCVNQLVSSVDETSKEFECNQCLEAHTIPKNGFKRWNIFDEINASESTQEEIYRGESAQKL